MWWIELRQSVDESIGGWRKKCILHRSKVHMYLSKGGGVCRHCWQCRHTIQSKSTGKSPGTTPYGPAIANPSIGHITSDGPSTPRAEWKARLARGEERAPRGQKGLRSRRTALRRHRHWHERTEIRWISRRHRLLPVKQMRQLCVGDQDSEIPSRTLPRRLGQFTTSVPPSQESSLRLQKGHQQTEARQKHHV